MNLPFLKKERLFPNIISVLFHPLIMPTLGVWFILNSGSLYSLIYPNAKIRILVIVFSLTYLIPLLILPLFMYFRLIGHWQASERNERIFPLAVTAVIYYFTFTFLKSYQVLAFVAFFMLTTAIVMILLLIINFFSKVSLHMAGIGGLAGLLLFMSMRVSPLNGWFFIGSLILAGIIAACRLQLNAHNLLQISIGFFVGMIPVFLFFILL